MLRRYLLHSLSISTLNCQVDGSDPFSSLSSTVNTQRYSCIKFSNICAFNII